MSEQDSSFPPEKRGDGEGRKKGPGYGWIITKDVIDDGYNNQRVGPSCVDPDIQARLIRDEGKQWQCRDDDGEVYAEGRILDLRTDSPREMGFEPLEDFCCPNWGATEIYYKEAGKWVRL